MTEYKILFAKTPQVSHIECEEYFPLRVVFDSSIGENRFVGFYGGDDNLLEFSVSSSTNIVRKLQIVTCNNYEIIEAALVPPRADKSGCVYLANPQHNNCGTFAMLVYKDGIDIKISEKIASKYYAMGQVLYGINDDNELVSIIVTDLQPDEIAHTIFELKANQHF